MNWQNIHVRPSVEFDLISKMLIIIILSALKTYKKPKSSNVILFLIRKLYEIEFHNVCLSAYVTLYVSVCVFCVYVCASVCMCACVCLSACLPLVYIYTCVCLSVCLPVCLSACLSFSLPLCNSFWFGCLNI